MKTKIVPHYPMDLGLRVKYESEPLPWWNGIVGTVVPNVRKKEGSCVVTVLFRKGNKKEKVEFLPKELKIVTRTETVD